MESRWYKMSKKEDGVYREKGCSNQQYQKISSIRFGKNCAKSQKVCKKSIYRDPNPSYDTLVCSKETHSNDTLELQLVQTEMSAKSGNNFVSMQENLKMTSLLFSVMRPHFKRMAKSTNIIFAFGVKKITIPCESLAKCEYFLNKIIFMVHFSLSER